MSTPQDFEDFRQEFTGYKPDNWETDIANERYNRFSAIEYMAVGALGLSGNELNASLILNLVQQHFPKYPNLSQQMISRVLNRSSAVMVRSAGVFSAKRRFNPTDSEEWQELLRLYGPGGSEGSKTTVSQFSTTPRNLDPGTYGDFEDDDDWYDLDDVDINSDPFLRSMVERAKGRDSAFYDSNWEMYS